MPTFDPRGVHVRFMKYKVTLREVLLGILPFFLISVIPAMPGILFFADTIEAVKTYQPLA